MKTEYTTEFYTDENITAERVFDAACDSEFLYNSIREKIDLLSNRNWTKKRITIIVEDVE